MDEGLDIAEMLVFSPRTSVLPHLIAEDVVPKDTTAKCT